MAPRWRGSRQASLFDIAELHAGRTVDWLEASEAPVVGQADLEGPTLLSRLLLEVGEAADQLPGWPLVVGFLRCQRRANVSYTVSPPITLMGVLTLLTTPANNERAWGLSHCAASISEGFGSRSPLARVSDQRISFSWPGASHQSHERCSPAALRRPKVTTLAGASLCSHSVAFSPASHADM